MAERALTYTERRGGGPMASPGSASVRSAVTGGANVWHPTVINLVILVIVEMGAYALLRYSFRSFHGG